MAKRVLTDQQMAELEQSGVAQIAKPQQSAKRVLSDDEMFKLEQSGAAKPAPTQGGGAGQTFLESYGNTATLGYLPQLQAIAGKLMPNPNADLDAKLSAQGFNIVAPEQSYLEMRDENIARQEAQAKENPRAAMAGTAAGVATGLLIPGANAAKAGQGLSGLSKVAAVAKSGAKSGALIGAAANPGDVEGEYNIAQIDRRLLNAAIGTATGASFSALSEIATTYGPKAAEAVYRYAREKAVKTLGPGKKAFEVLKKSGQEQELGKELLEQGAIPILGTPGRIAKRVDKLKEKAGVEIGDLIDSVGDDAVIDGAELGVRLLDSPKLSQLRSTPGMESVATAYEKFAETLASRGKMNLRQAQELRKGIDKSINFNKSIPEMKGQQSALYDVRTLVRDTMNDVVNALGSGGKKGALKVANRKYSNFSKAGDLLDKKLAQDSSNRSISLTDYIAMNAGDTAAIKAALTVGNKAVRTFGNSVTARGANAVANVLNMTPAAAALAKQSPVAFQVLVSSLTKANTKSEDPANNRSLILLLRKNPDLIDTIKDEKLRQRLRSAASVQE
jgi:hypothetical protein